MGKLTAENVETPYTKGLSRMADVKKKVSKKRLSFFIYKGRLKAALYHT